MLPQVSELEALLNEQIAEHQRMLKHLQSQQAAMKLFDLKAMDIAKNGQEASRLRIMSLETKCRAIVMQVARDHGKQGNLTIAEVAALCPLRSASLLRQRALLKDLMKQIADRAGISGKLARAVLGHLNLVVRLLAGAVGKGGLYTKHGVPQMSGRIGVMEAVG
jgi:hypothetical protein